MSVRLSEGSVVSQPIEGLASDETPWGLARTSDGFLTLVGPATVARVDLKGHVTERVALQRPQLNLFGLGETLLLQPATPTADEAVLRRVRLPGGDSQSVGSLRSSQYETRAETLARNLVGCGSTQVDELPCWFNHDLRIDRVPRVGDGRMFRIRLSGFEDWSSRQGVEGIEDPGPIIDVHIDRSRALWVLLRRPASVPARFVLARFSDAGELTDSTEVAGRPRLILDAEARRCLLLAGTGQFLSVTMPCRPTRGHLGVVDRVPPLPSGDRRQRCRRPVRHLDGRHPSPGHRSTLCLASLLPTVRRLIWFSAGSRRRSLRCHPCRRLQPAPSCSDPLGTVGQPRHCGVDDRECRGALVSAGWPGRRHETADPSRGPLGIHMRLGGQSRDLESRFRMDEGGCGSLGT